MELTVSTANTHEARMLRHSEGLIPFMNRSVDVLMMQEVVGVNPEELSDSLGENYRLAVFSQEMGLAIALSSKNKT